MKVIMSNKLNQFPESIKNSFGLIGLTIIIFRLNSMLLDRLILLKKVDINNGFCFLSITRNPPQGLSKSKFITLNPNESISSFTWLYISILAFTARIFYKISWGLIKCDFQT